MGPQGQGDGVLSFLQWPGCPTALGTTQSLFTLGCPWGNEFFSPLSLSSFPTEAGKPFNYTLSQTQRGTMPSGHLGSKEETPFRFSLLPRGPPLCTNNGEFLGPGWEGQRSRKQPWGWGEVQGSGASELWCVRQRWKRPPAWWSFLIPLIRVHRKDCDLSSGLQVQSGELLCQILVPPGNFKPFNEKQVMEVRDLNLIPKWKAAFRPY